MATFLFYLMALGAVVASLIVVLARNPITSVLALLGSFFCLATIYLLAGFQLLAAVQILVYGGAIMVLFLFVIMLLNLAHQGPAQSVDFALLQKRRPALAIAIVAALLIAGLVAVQKSRAALVRPSGVALPTAGIDDPVALAGAMFSRYLLPFEATSVLLLATAVAVLVLAKRDRLAKSRSIPASQAAEPARQGHVAPEPASPASSGAVPRASHASPPRRRDEGPTGTRS